MASRTDAGEPVAVPPRESPAGSATGATAAPRARRRHTVWGLVAAVVAVLSAVLLPFAPVRMSTPEVSWPQQAERPVSTMLELTSQRPVTLDATFGCATARAAAQTPDGVLLATIRPDSAQAEAAGLVVSTRDGGLRIVSAGKRLLSAPVPAGDCTYRVLADGSGVRVLQDGAVVGRAGTAALPDVDVLATSLRTLAPADGEQLRVRVAVDDQFATGPTALKLVLVVVCLVASVLSLVWLRTVPATRRTARRRRRHGAAGWARRGVDAVVVAVLLLWTLITPMTGDDGYYAAMARNSPLEGYVGNYYQLLNQSFTPFTWFYRVLGWWEQVAGNAPAVLRVPALVAGLATYLIAARLVAAAPFRGQRHRTGAHALLAVAFLAWWLPQDMGMRPEAMVALAGAGTLLLVVSALRRGSLLRYGLAVVVAAVGFVCHPTGFVALAPLLAGLPGLWRMARAGRWYVTAVRLLAVVAPGAVAGVVAFGDGTLRDFQRGQEIFLAAQDQLGWSDEYQRYAMLLGPDFMGAYAKRLPVLLTIAALAGWLVLAATLRGRGRPLPVVLHLSAVSFALGLLLLWLTPSKWSFHFGSLVGVGAVFLTLLLTGLPRLVRQANRDRVLPVPAVLAALGAGVVAVALSFVGPNSWPSSWMLGVPQANVPPSLLGIPLGSLAGWAVLAALLTAALWARRRRRAAGPAGSRSWRAAAVVAVPVVLVGALVVDTGYLVGTFGYAAARPQQSWSPWGDTLRDPLASDCHASGAFQVLPDTGARTLTPLPDQGAVDTGTTFVEGSGWYDPVAPATPPGQIWGSLQPAQGNAAVGGITTGWWALPTADPAEEGLVVTAAGNLTTGNELVAEYGRSGPQGVTTVSRKVLDDDQDTAFWRTLTLDPRAARRAGADAVRLVAYDGTTAPGGWLAFSEPEVRQWESVESYLGGDEAVAVAWQIALLFPCQQQPRVQYGVTQPSDYGVLYGPTMGAAIGDATWLVDRGGLYGPVLREASVTSLPTRLPGARRVTDVTTYRFEYPYPAGKYDLRRDTVTVNGWAPPPGWGDRPAR